MVYTYGNVHDCFDTVYLEIYSYTVFELLCVCVCVCVRACLCVWGVCLCVA